MAEKPGEIMLENPYFAVTVISFFILYAIALLFCAAWGLYILPSACTSQSLRMNLRIMLVCSVIMITAFIGTAVCKHSCREYTDQFKNTIKSANYHFPNWMAGITFIFSAVYVGALFTALDKFDEVCKSSTYNNFKQLADIMKIICFVVMFLMALLLANRFRKSSYVSRLQRNRKIEAAQKAVPGVEMQGRNIGGPAPRQQPRQKPPDEIWGNNDYGNWAPYQG